ncbi:MAG: single-stranded DNA-binding protein [Bacteroidetes bacterium]|nr:single-stranded DNA-binding protein [Bacteroidota bacterium]
MNHVNLIGKACSDAKFIILGNGRKIVKFSLSTKENYLDEDGKIKSKNTLHNLTAWGKWVKILEQTEIKGTNLAVEGKLVSRFYKSNGSTRLISEVEINDLTLIQTK